MISTTEQALGSRVASPAKESARPRVQHVGETPSPIDEVIETASPSTGLKYSSTNYQQVVANFPNEGIPLNEVERQAIIEALKVANWIQKDAATLLGVSPRAISYKIKMLEIKIKEERARNS